MKNIGNPIIIAYHLLWTCYGSWLPNDPRGSTSTVVRSDVLRELGELHYGRREIQPAGRVIRAFYNEARGRLMHELLAFAEDQFPIVADCFARAIERHRYTCYACVVMPDHVHLLIRKHRDDAEQMIETLQSESADDLRRLGVRPPDHPVWTSNGGWKVFLDHPAGVRRTIRYIERNPLPWRMPIQRHAFMKPYDDWPLHPGHSQNSPYVKLLRAAGRYPNDYDG